MNQNNKKELSKNQEVFMVAPKESNPHIHSTHLRIANISPSTEKAIKSRRGEKTTPKNVF